MKHVKYKVLSLSLILLFALSCSKKETKRPLPVVAIATVEQRDVPIYIDTIGQAIPPVTVNIRPQAAGKLIGVYAQQGAIVEVGDLLYTIDPRPYEAILQETKSQLIHDLALLDIADKTVDRFNKVVEGDFISILTFEQYQANAAAARAQVGIDVAAIEAAQINVNYCQVLAPVSGKISYYNVDVGNIVAVDDPTALTVVRPFSPVDILFSLSQQHFELIRKVQGDEGFWPFIATLPEKPDQPIEGTTFFLDNQIDQNTGTILLKGRFPNMDRELWPGEFMKVKVLHKIAPNALVVPPGAVLMGKDGAYLYIVDHDNTAIARNIKVLMRSEEMIAFESSEIKSGDTVVVDGQINIATGTNVQTKPQEKQSPPMFPSLLQ
jgi:multidrug efflux system membrane fusion protein